MGGTAIVAVAAAFWGRLKMLATRITSTAITHAQMTDPAGNTLLEYLFANAYRSPYGMKTYGAELKFVRPRSRYQLVGFETCTPEPMWFWLGWRPVLVRYDYGAGGGGDNRPRGIHASTLRGVVDLAALFVKALEWHNDRTHSKNKSGRRFMIEPILGSMADVPAQAGSVPQAAKQLSEAMPTGGDAKKFLTWKENELGNPVDDDPWKGLVFPAMVDALVRTVDMWLKSEAWYKERRINWRYGIGLVGKPGTGKTSLVRAVSQDRDLPVYPFDLATMSNMDFRKGWSVALSNTPCVVLLEDIDGVFQGRENVVAQSRDGFSAGVTFDCLLNAISGVQNANGILLILTTNRPESLDEALIRPGRIDKMFELPDMPAECRRKLAELILSDCPELIDRVVGEGEGDTPAQFQNRCRDVALADYWRKRDAEIGKE